MDHLESMVEFCLLTYNFTREEKVDDEAVEKLFFLLIIIDYGGLKKNAVFLFEWTVLYYYLYKS